MVKKKMTIESLAVLMQHEFSELRKEVATKQELREFRREVIERFEHIEDDIRDIKNVLGPLVRITANLEHQVRTLHIRLNRVERKLGLK